MRRPIVLLALALLAALVLAGCGDVGDQDADDDGIYDTTERAGWPVTVDHLAERVRYTTTSDAHDADTDDDGIPDGDEFQFGTDPRKADTDGDGLSDCQEVRHTVRAECEDEAFHGPFDGGLGTDAAKADSDPGVSLYVLEHGYADSSGTLADGRPGWGDGIGDGEELAGYNVTVPGGAVRFVKTDPRNGDSDGDGLDDGDERFTYGSDPTVPDSDGDGCDDGLDPLPGYAEHVGPGLGSLQLDHSTGSSPGAEIILTITLVNSVLFVPSSGSIHQDPGSIRDWSSDEPPPVHSTSCTFTPRSWIPLVVAASDSESRPVPIDLASGNPTADGSGVALAYWNMARKQLSWSPDGKDSWPEESGVTFSGADGSFTLRPSLVNG